MEVGKRVYDKQTLSKGTIRWKGQLPTGKNPEPEWLGVEWDDPNRGNHRGTHKDVQYFQCAYSNTSASFVNPQKVELGRSLLNALNEKYCLVAPSDDQDAYVLTESNQQVMIEFVGAQKIQAKISDLPQRKVISLSDKCISHATDPNEQPLWTACPSLHDLDISLNLFDQWKHIEEVVKECTSLKSLNLSGNLLANPEASSLQFPKSLEVLVLHRMHLENEHLIWLSSQVGDFIQELHLCYNHLSDQLPLASPRFSSLQVLDLENNQVSDWNAWRGYFSTLPHLEKLVLNENPLKEISVPQNPSPPVESLKAIALSRTQLSSWKSINRLNEEFPNLEELRLSDVPLFDTVSSRTQRYFVIARVSSISKLNGSNISSREREDAEKYYLHNSFETLSKLETDQQKQDFLADNPRYESLLQRFGTPLLSGGSNESTTLAGSMITLSLCDGYQLVKTKPLPSSITVGNLKVIINHLLKIRPVDQILSFKRDMDDLGDSSLDDDTQSLSYYGVLDQSIIVVKQM